MLFLALRAPSPRQGGAGGVSQIPFLTWGLEGTPWPFLSFFSFRLNEMNLL